MHKSKFKAFLYERSCNGTIKITFVPIVPDHFDKRNVLNFAQQNKIELNFMDHQSEHEDFLQINDEYEITFKKAKHPPKRIPKSTSIGNGKRNHNR